uniref:Putative Phospho-N-acetylmuramoyl-pentapeptide-transferase n=1 Tax=Magnetococcus massalia (strain MO-1) TaxID=451514 RepID=A0A1S7LJ12_MAGMO|nr:putative Phospho-N-acetylmuramoyl-pentapeptide-transferase [Candidatus Magnetococcus massalia]
MHLLFALLVCWGLLVLFKRYAACLGLIDQPDGDRKLHAVATPVVGGLAMAGGLLAGLGWLALQGMMDQKALALILSIALLALLGVLDDRLDLRVSVRFLVQGGVSLILWWGGSYLFHFGDLLGLGLVELTPLEPLFTIICVVGVINALNMVDGMDGVAGSITLAAMIGYLILAWMAGNMLVLQVALLTIMVLLPFLFYNLRWGPHQRARLFMGDAGSMVLGLLLSWCAIELTQSENPVLSPSAVLWVVVIPLFDLFGSIAHRVICHRPAFTADRNHIHHLILALGLPESQVPQTMFILSLLGVGVAINFAMGPLDSPLPVIMFCLLFALYVRFVVRFWYLRSSPDIS